MIIGKGRERRQPTTSQAKTEDTDRSQAHKTATHSTRSQDVHSLSCEDSRFIRGLCDSYNDKNSIDEISAYIKSVQRAIAHLRAQFQDFKAEYTEDITQVKRSLHDLNGRAHTGVDAQGADVIEK